MLCWVTVTNLHIFMRNSRKAWMKSDLKLAPCWKRQEYLLLYAGVDWLLQARKGDLCTEQGLTYLEVKHLLLLHYCICIVFYLMLKLEGKSVKDHPVVLRLVEIRAYLEKIRPMEVRLQPQVEKLLRAVTLAKESESRLALRVNREQAIPFCSDGR